VCRCRRRSRTLEMKQRKMGPCMSGSDASTILIESGGEKGLEKHPFPCFCQIV